MICSDVSLTDLVSFHIPIDDFVFKPGAVLYHITEPAQAVHCVRHGVVKLIRFDRSGHQRIVRVLKQNDVAGLEAILNGKHRHTAIALTEVRTCRVPMGYFQQFIARHPHLQMRLLERSQEALLEMDQWVSELVNTAISARIRVARLLLRLRIGETDCIHRLSLADSGAILGLAPETLCRLLKELIDEKILSKVGKGRAGRHYLGNIPALLAISQEA